MSLAEFFYVHRRSWNWLRFFKRLDIASCRASMDELQRFIAQGKLFVSSSKLSCEIDGGLMSIQLLSACVSAGSRSEPGGVAAEFKSHWSRIPLRNCFLLFGEETVSVVHLTGASVESILSQSAYPDGRSFSSCKGKRVGPEIAFQQ